MIEAKAPASAKPGGKVTVIVRAQRLEVGPKAAAGLNKLKGKIAATSISAAAPSMRSTPRA